MNLRLLPVPPTSPHFLQEASLAPFCCVPDTVMGFGDAGKTIVE